MIKLGSKYIGDGYPTFITFEAGSTHNGLNSAKQLIREAANSGADAVKFQIFDPDELIQDRSLMYSYDVLLDRKTGKTEKITEPLYDIFVRRSLEEHEWRELKLFSENLNLTFFATIGDQFGLDVVKSIGCESVKVASADINYVQFLREIAKLGVSIQLDTGSATLGEIEQAIDVVTAAGNNEIIIHNCPSGYPAKLETINLKMIPSLKSLFGYPVAYSDHSPGGVMDVAAIALGANMIEKTITTDRLTRSVEHIMSLEPHELAQFVKNIRDVERAFGNSRRLMSADDLENRLSVRRSVVLAEPAAKGQKLKDVRIKFKRPGFGISPDKYDACLELKFRSNMEMGDIVFMSNLIS